MMTEDLFLSPRAFWLRPRHIEIARHRSEQFRRSDNKKFTLSTIQRAVRQPLFWVFGALYPSAVLAQQGYNCEFFARFALKG